MEKIRKFLSTEVVLSIIIPLIISLFSYAVAHGKYTERLDGTEQKIEAINKSGTERLQSHLIEDVQKNGQIISEIKVLQTKIDQIREDIQDLKRSSRNGR